MKILLVGSGTGGINLLAVPLQNNLHHHPIMARGRDDAIKSVKKHKFDLVILSEVPNTKMGDIQRALRSTPGNQDLHFLTIHKDTLPQVAYMLNGEPKRT